MFDCILVNGDSYSARASHKVYADFLAEYTGIPVVNIAVTGSNNDRIRRSTIEKLLEIKQQYSKPLVIVGWSFIKRLEVWYYGNHESIVNRIPDTENKLTHQQPRLVTLNLLLYKGQATPEQKCLVNEDLFVHKQLIDFYTSLFLFTHTVRSLGAEFFCFSAAKNNEVQIENFPYLESLQQVNWCRNQPVIHQLHEFYIQRWAEDNDHKRKKETGHLSEDGHEKFCNLLLEWLQDANIEIRKDTHV